MAGLKYLLRGLATFAPGVALFVQTRTGGTTSALYCYSVWLRHLVLAQRSGLCVGVPQNIVELGPGDSLGTGIAALLSGAFRYTGLDVIAFATPQRNLQILSELCALFEERFDIPAPDLFPDWKPYLEDYAFPSGLLTDAVLDEAMSVHRIETLRKSLLHAPNAASVEDPIAYAVPWTQSSVPAGAADMVIAQTVVQYLPDLVSAYSAIASWLKPSGFFSAQIDLKCHGSASEWNGHYAYSDREWAMIRGRRSYYLNRQPLSVHLKAMQEAGLEVVSVKRLTRRSRLALAELAPPFNSMSQSDLTTAGAFIQARRSASRK
jgi:SAM-dependent methyltransferase